MSRSPIRNMRTDSPPSLKVGFASTPSIVQLSTGADGCIYATVSIRMSICISETPAHKRWKRYGKGKPDYRLLNHIVSEDAT